MKTDYLEKREQAIRDGGFYGNNGIWNSIITLPGDNKLYRERVETIILKDGKYVFLKKKPNGEYYLPGGSTEKDVTNIKQAINECREEAHINITNVKDTGITYKKIYDTIPNYIKDHSEIEWHGLFSHVFVGEYESPYTGKVDKFDEDPFIRSGKWYPTKECFKFFRKEHRDALLWYLKQKENDIETEPVIESYIFNYFKNKRLLKKISNNPDIERSAVDQMITVLKKEYLELSKTSKIQKERKKPDVSEIYHPVLTFEFNDGHITVAICFDDKEISDGIATHVDEIGDIIVVFPCFFKTTKENQIFTILHELGHIRLNHLELKNTKRNIHGDDITQEYRQKMMFKGKAMYPEINADLYAVLNGASMYAILGSHFSKDIDGEYDYRFTNKELSDRYNNVFKQYGKLRGFNESEGDKLLTLITEAVQCNVKIKDILNNEEQNELCINIFNNIKDGMD